MTEAQALESLLVRFMRHIQHTNKNDLRLDESSPFLTTHEKLSLGALVDRSGLSHMVEGQK